MREGGHVREHAAWRNRWDKSSMGPALSFVVAGYSLHSSYRVLGHRSGLAMRRASGGSCPCCCLLLDLGAWVRCELGVEVKLLWLRGPTYPSIKSGGTVSQIFWQELPWPLTAAAPPCATQILFFIPRALAPHDSPPSRSPTNQPSHIRNSTR